MLCEKKIASKKNDIYNFFYNRKMLSYTFLKEGCVRTYLQ